VKYIALDMDFFSGTNCMKALKKEASRITEDQISVIMLTEKTRQSIPDIFFQSSGMDYLVSDNGAEIRNVSGDQVLYRNYLSSKTTCALKHLLYKTKTVPEIQVNGKIYMERKDYRRLQSRSIKSESGSRQIHPVYGAVQLLQLFEGKIERVRITSESNSSISDLHSQLKKALSFNEDKLVCHRNEMEIIPSGTNKANALEIIKSQLNISSRDLIPVPQSLMSVRTRCV